VKFESRRKSNRKLKVGYVSPDFRKHATRHFILPLLENHDHNAFEIFAYANLLEKADSFTDKYESLVDHWCDVTSLTSDTFARKIYDDQIDILLDLAGHTHGNRLLTFARRPAPIQVTWLGFGYTTGVRAIDYILMDEHCAPPGSEALFAETPWRLETTPFAFRPASDMGVPGVTPAVSTGSVTFVSLSRSIRLNARVVAVWSEILKRVPKSRLVIDSRSFKIQETRHALTESFAAHGIASDRLSIGYHTPPWDVLRSADITLDCFPHNSGTTLFESLYMGLPYITLAGRPSVGRLGSSILHGLGHPEWVAHSEADYIDKAVALASDLDRLAFLRASLRDEMERSPLMDEHGFARRVEGAYRSMWQRWCEANA
jgi:predicted O-linked N-acetylglucosamine transferase (SPINDLY family)